MVDIYEVKATGFIRESLQEEREFLMKQGIMPINDVFFPHYNKHRKIKLFYGSFGCFGEGQNVITSIGSKTIEKVCVGDIVLSRNLNTNTDEWQAVSKTFVHNNSRKTVRVTLTNGHTITATEDHKFYFGRYWVSLKNILSLVNGKDMEKNTGILSLRSVIRRGNKNIQLERMRTRSYNETSKGCVRLSKDNAKIRRGANKNYKGSQNNLRDISRYTRNTTNRKPQKQHKNRQSLRESRMDVAGRQCSGRLPKGFVLYATGRTASQFGIKRKTSIRNKREIQARFLREEKNISRVWSIRKHDKRHSFTYQLEVADIVRYEYIDDVKKVYDISVEGNSNFYLDCGNPILVHNSGKSVFICQDLITQALNNPYFKCYYGRKVFEDVHHSCFETLYETIESMGLERYFKYSTADNSSKVIRCVLNGNMFIPFGSDRPERLKSIKDPTHIWCEEFDQFSDSEGEKPGDFQTLFPRLRTIKADTEFIASFNTAPVYENHWILKYFFPELYKGEDKPEQWFNDMLSEFDVLKCFANYTDNHFIDQDAYYKQLKMSSGGNQLILDAIANGAWGTTDNKNPWLYAFDVQKHVKETIPFLPSFPVYISFDFNNDPFEASAWQYSPNMGSGSSFIHCIKEFSGFMKIEEMCERILAAFPASIIHVTGDRSGQNEDVGRNQTLYQMIGALLGINNKMLNLNSTNLEHADSRLFLNAMFNNYPNVYLSREGCPNLIRQCQIAKVDVKNNKPSHLLKDRGIYKMDMFDSGRYFFQTYFHEFAQKKYFKAIKKK